MVTGTLKNVPVVEVCKFPSHQLLVVRLHPGMITSAVELWKIADALRQAFGLERVAPPFAGINGFHIWIQLGSKLPVDFRAAEVAMNNLLKESDSDIRVTGMPIPQFEEASGAKL